MITLRRLLSAIFLFFISVAIIGGQEEKLPKGWQQVEDPWFNYIFKEGDRPFLEKLLAQAPEAYGIVTGFFNAAPKKKATIILYGEQDAPAFGGFTAPMPMRIGLVVPYSQNTSAKGLLVHEFAHYMQAERGDAGLLLSAFAPFIPDLSKFIGVTLSEISLEGTTSFLDGTRRREFSLLPVRAAVLEGRFWDRQKVSSGGLVYPGALRPYLSGLLFQDWVYERLGPLGYQNILQNKKLFLAAYEENVVLDYTGLDMTNIWGEITSKLYAQWSYALHLPRGDIATPQSSFLQERWTMLQATNRGFLHLRYANQGKMQLGFWRPDEVVAKPKRLGITKDERTRDVLIPDLGRFIPVKGLLPDEFGVDAQGQNIAAIVNAGSKGGLALSKNKNKLIVGKLIWHNEEKVSFKKGFSLEGSGWEAPCFSPDGSRLFALRRESDTARAVEIDLKNRSHRFLALPLGISVNSLAFSPDGRKLAISYVQGGQFDVGIYNLEDHQFTPITQDDADDRYARFLADGRFVFSSDRENSVFIYSFDGESFSRILVDAVGAWAAVEDGRGGLWYSTLTANGPAIARMSSEKLLKTDGGSAHSQSFTQEEFRALVPDWVHRRNEIWDFYLGLGKQAPGRARAHREDGLYEDDLNVGEPSLAISRAKPYLDLPRPVAWLPTFSLGDGLNSYGGELLATSLLEAISLELALAYVPKDAQIHGTVALGFTAFDIELNLFWQHDYFAQIIDNSKTYVATQRVAGNILAPLLRQRSCWGNMFNLSALASGALEQELIDNNAFSFGDAFSMPWNSAFVLSGGLGASLMDTRAREPVYGGNYLYSDVLAYAEQPQDNGIFSLGGRSHLEGQLLFEPGQALGIAANLAYRPLGEAWKYSAIAEPRWDYGHTAPWRFSIKGRFLNSAVVVEKAAPYISNDAFGSWLGLATHWEGSKINHLVLQKLLDVEAALTWRINLMYNPMAVEIIGLWRMDFAQENSSTPKFILRLNLAGSLIDLAHKNKFGVLK